MCCGDMLLIGKALAFTVALGFSNPVTLSPGVNSQALLFVAVVDCELVAVKGALA